MIWAIQTGDKFQIKFGYNPEIVELVKQVPGRVWVPEAKAWEIPSARIGFLINQVRGTQYEQELHIQSTEDLNVNSDIGSTQNIPDYDISDYKYRVQTGLTPLPHQLDGLKYAAWRYSHGLKSGFLLADQPGLTKTAQTMNIALYLKQHYGLRRCLVIVCMNSAKYNWVEDIIKNTDGEYTPYLLGSRFKKRPKNSTELRNDTGSKEKYEDLLNLTCFDNPEITLPFFSVVNIEAVRYKVGKHYPIIERLIELINSGEIGMVALDEIHMNCSMSSQQGKNLLKLKQKTQQSGCYWLPMTGTPITSKPTDVFLPLRLVDGHSYNAYYMWNNEFCVFGTFNDIIGYKNIPELKSMLEPNMLRRKKEDVLDLPPKIHFTRYVENTPYQKKLYEYVQTELRKKRSTLQYSNLQMGNELLRLRQVNGNPEIIDKQLVLDSSYMSKNARLRELMYIVDEIIANGQKVIIFSNWVESLRTLHRFIKTKYKVCCFTGTMKDADRQLHKKTFIENPEYKILLGTVGALGASHTLTVARNIIFYDVPWNPSTIEQCEDRCHRPGTTDSVNVYTLVTKDTIDEVVHNILNKKEGVAQYIVDDELDVVSHPELLDMLL